MTSCLWMNVRGVNGPMEVRRRTPADWYAMAVPLVLLCTGGAALYCLYWMAQP